MNARSAVRARSFFLVLVTCIVFLTGGPAVAEVRVVSASVPVVIIVDQSGSMAGGFDWLGKLVGETDAGLIESYGRTAAGRFGLVGFADSAHTSSFDDALLGTAQAVDERIRELRIGGHGAEDGYQALRLTLELYGWAPEAGLNVLLVTDEDRDILDPLEDAETLAADLAATKTVLDVLVNLRFHCGDGSPAIGMNALGDGYALRRDTVLRCSGVTPSRGRHIHGTDENDSSIRDYLDLALGTGGTAWAIDAVRRAGRERAALFAAAYGEVRAQRYAARLEALPIQADAKAYPPRLRVGEVVNLDSSASRHNHPDRYLDAWEWDYDGDGTFDADGPVVSTTFQAPGEYAVTLQVADRGLGIATRTQVIVRVDAE